MAKPALVDADKKCPECGDEMPAGAEKCPECGHDMSAKEASAIDSLFDDLIGTKYSPDQEREDNGRFVGSGGGSGGSRHYGLTSMIHTPRSTGHVDSAPRKREAASSGKRISHQKAVDGSELRLRQIIARHPEASLVSRFVRIERPAHTPFGKLVQKMKSAVKHAPEKLPGWRTAHQANMLVAAGKEIAARIRAFVKGDSTADLLFDDLLGEARG